MFPLRDDNPTELTPYVTFIIILANVAAWLLIQHAGSGPGFVESICTYGAVPGEITGSVEPGQWVDLGGEGCRLGGLRWEAVLTSMFMHGGWGHLLGNMWFLWVFGNNIEDSMGHVRFLVFYLLCGVIAAGAHIVSMPASGIPTVGASGAISGVMGAYLVLYPKVRVYTLFFFFFFIRVFMVPAWVWLLVWVGIQLLLGVASTGAESGVAFWAHLGGFAAGLLLVRPFERPLLVQAKRSQVKLPPDELRRLRW
jgi:membrane associated rhomboid family serine protease